MKIRASLLIVLGVLLGLRFEAEAALPTYITLAWNPVPGAAFYTVYWGGQSGDYSQSQSSLAPQASLPIAILANQAYYFSVTDTSGNGIESTNSAEVVYTPPPDSPRITRPPLITSVVAGSMPNTAMVTWGDQGGGTYVLYQWQGTLDNYQNNNPIITLAAQTNLLVTALASNQSYVFMVYSVDANTWATPVAYTNSANPVTAPVNPAPVALAPLAASVAPGSAPNTAMVAWGGEDEGDTYVLFQWEGTLDYYQSANPVIALATQTNLLVTGLASNQSYVFMVYAVDAGSWGTPVAYTNSSPPPVVGGNEFTWTTNDSTLTITGYIGPGGAVGIPRTINGLPVVDIGDWAFFYCTNVTSVTIPDTVTNIGYCAFYFCTNLTNAALGGGVTTIGSSAFDECVSLQDAGIPDTVTNIGSEAFYDCASLANITIPQSVATIGAASFAGCTNLPAIQVDSRNVAFTGIDGALYTFVPTNLIQYPAGNAAVSFEVPYGVARIGVSAFYRCANLTNITLPQSVISIGSYAFAGCPGLDAVNLFGSPPVADSSIFFSENNDYSVPGDAILNLVETSSSSTTTNSPSIADINITSFPNFLQAMNPTNNPGPVMILSTGDATMKSSQGAVESGYSTQISKFMHFGGGIASAGSGWNFANRLLGINLSGPGVTVASAPDTNWYSGYWSMPADATLTNALYDAAGFFYTTYTNFNQIVVAYIVGPDESTNFAIQSIASFPNGAATTLATINASNPVYGGAVTNIAVATGNFDARILVQSSQPAHIIAFGCEATNQHNLVQCNMAFAGQKEMLWTNVNTNVFIPIMQALDPALVLFQNKNNTSNELSSGYANFIQFWSNALPFAEQLHIGTYQTAAAGYDNLGMNTAIRAVCVAENEPFVDLYYDMPSALTMSNLNWFIDGVELKPSAVFEGELIWDRLFATLGAIDFSDTNYWNAPQVPLGATASHQ